MATEPDSHPRNIVAANLRRIIEAEGISIRAWALARGLNVRLIDRLTKSENAVTLDKLGEIAAAIGCEPWHLLIAEFDPSNPPDAPITAEERAMLQRLRRLLGPDGPAR